MRKNKKRKEEKLLFLFVLISFFIMIVGSGYAVYSYYDGKEKLHSIETGCFSITFLEGTNEIRLTRADQMEEEEGASSPEYKFMVENNCSITASYELQVETMEEEQGTSSMVTVSIDVDNPMLLSSLEKGSATLKETKVANVIRKEQLTAGASKTYSLHFWLEKKEEIENPEYKGRIVLNAKGSK